MGKKKASPFVIFVNEKRDLNPEWRNKSASELEQLCQPMWQRLSPGERQIYKKIKMELNTIGQQSKKSEVRDGCYDSHGRSLKEEIKKCYHGGLFGGGGYGEFPTSGAGGYGSGYGVPFGRGGYGAGYGVPFGRGGYGGPLSGCYGGVGSYGGPFGGSNRVGGPLGWGYESVGGYDVGQRMLKAKNDAQSNEVKSRAVVHISETKAAQLEETLGQNDNMKDYEDRSSSGNSFLATLQQNHEANAERTKGEIPQLEAREEGSNVKDYITQEPSQMLPDVDLNKSFRKEQEMELSGKSKMEIKKECSIKAEIKEEYTGEVKREYPDSLTHEMMSRKKNYSSVKYLPLFKGDIKIEIKEEDIDREIKGDFSDSLRLKSEIKIEMKHEYTEQVKTVPLSKLKGATLKERLKQLEQEAYARCNICQMKFSDGRKLQSHRKTHKENFTCDLCQKKIKGKHWFMKHIKTCDGDNRPKWAQQAPIVAPGEVREVLEICGKEYDVHWGTVTNSYTHEQRVVARSWVNGKAWAGRGATRDEARSKLIKFLKDHVKKTMDAGLMDVGNKKVSCSKCGTQFSNKANLELHMFMHRNK